MTSVWRLNADEAGRQGREKLQQLCSANAFADHNDASNIYAVNLKNRLRDVETDRARGLGRLQGKGLMRGWPMELVNYYPMGFWVPDISWSHD